MDDLAVHQDHDRAGRGECATGLDRLIESGRREDHDECGSLVQGGTVACGNCMPYENNQPIWVCRDLTVSIEEAWKAAKSFN